MTPRTPPTKTLLWYTNKSLTLLIRQVSEQLSVLKQIKAVLPAHLANHALHCVINNNKLVIFTDSAAWASQLRFYDSVMLGVISKIAVTKAVTSLKVKVTISTPEGNSPKKTAIIPSQTVVDELHAYSYSTADPQLKDALGRLSTTLARLQKQV